jgi:4-hydroxythreonine-4-phosphate dehydrogenase
MGDPCGVGPETIVGAWSSPRLHACCRPLVVGHGEIMRRAIRLLVSPIEVTTIESVEDALPSPTALPCLDGCSDDAASAPPAKIDPRGGAAAYHALKSAAQLALDGSIDALVTAPLNKAALWAAGHHYPGHTELLAELCGITDVAMMLYLPAEALPGREHGLGVVHVTLHCSLRDVFAGLTTGAIVAKALLLNETLARLHKQPPRIVVCALNPHAGEEGLFGDEERRIIAPAVKELRATGLDVAGPLPADTAMVKARDGFYDGVVAMYHDQGHIALKLLGMHHAVNVTLGLPIVRTSVAHGTAFDLAWQGKADSRSMVAAVELASRLAAQRVANSE